ncbi:MAG: hypothetical protein IJG55_02115 [Synergistaceae bacterium]|nr:hypothetical protein [Synergistaceae bacterium]
MRTRIITAILILSAFAFTCYAETEKSAKKSAADKAFHTKNDSGHAQIYRPDKSENEYLQKLIKTKADKFEVRTYSDSRTGLAISYDIYLPEDYSADKKYPVVFFVGDASCMNKPPMYSVTQGLGALVWTEHECIVIVPTFPEVIIDDHDGFTVSEYYEVLSDFTIDAETMYSIDPLRVYATGQSMGCMAFMRMAGEAPEKFSACLFVSGQWNIDELHNLWGRFIYAVSYGDDKALKGQNEVFDMIAKSGLSYALYDNIDAENQNISLHPSQYMNFVRYKKGTTIPYHIRDSKRGYSEHMSSFDYVYANKEIRDWLLSQRKKDAQ